MPGTLTITTLSDGTNSTSSTNCIQGSAKAWVNFNGTTSPGTIRAQYNVSSVTKSAAGSYTVNFTSALASANYSVVASCRGQSDTDANTTVAGPGTLTTSTVTIFCKNNGNTLVDSSVICVSVNI